MKIIFASSNLGKIHELQSMVSDLPIYLIPQSDFKVSAIAETGVTFIENALLKARHACQETKLPTIADDSGLVVEDLQGAPGIYSARYAGENATTEQNIKKLLAKLQNTRQENRSAYFYCALVMLRHADDPTPIICEGKWHGKILTSPRGNQGFGYDPVFYVPEKNCSAAELTSTIKNQLSHRGKALRLLVEKLHENTSANSTKS